MAERARLPVEGAAESDATDSLLGLQLKEGHNQVARTDTGMELLVRAAPGRQLEYLIVDARGELVDQLIDVSVTNKAKETTCWKCGVDSAGDTHCWVIPCPDITGPWEPGKVLDQGFVLRY